ncbi:MAG: AraC family transcriptional regulator [Planctomycetes bacterium]|nr:AraC family transcriptional regulator [Planctomycetota bacterium]
MGSSHGALRYKIDREACLSPCLHQVGWAIFSETVHDAENLPAHRHPTAYEICYIAHGTVDWCVEDRVFEVDPGYVFLTMPGETHGGLHDIMNPCELFWVQVEWPRTGVLPGLTPAETESLAQNYSGIEQRRFPGASEVPILFKRIVEEHRNPSDFSAIVVRTALIELMVSVIRSYELQRQRSATDAEHSRPIGFALQWIDQNVGSDLKIDEIARRVGLSSTVFYKRFHEEVHVTPGEYLTQRRIHKAKALLADSSQSITAIAHALGYSSSQYFATIFKKITGVTPRVYRSTGLK